MYQKRNSCGKAESGLQKSEVRNLKFGERFLREVGVSKSRKSETENAEKIEPSSQELAQKAHRQTIEDLVSEYGQHMASAQIYELLHSGTEKQIRVMTVSEYNKMFSKKDSCIAGHCDEIGNIYVKDISPEMVKHVSVHETLYRCADRTWEKDANGNKKTTCGLRETTCYADGTKVRLHKAANKGITEMYTLRELERQGETNPLFSDITYSEARIWMERIEPLVGRENMAAAYFSENKKGFTEAFQRLNNGNDLAWEVFSRDLDVLDSDAGLSMKEYARKRLEDIYCTMLQNQEKE